MWAKFDLSKTHLSMQKCHTGQTLDLSLTLCKPPFTLACVVLLPHDTTKSLPDTILIFQLCQKHQAPHRNWLYGILNMQLKSNLHLMSCRCKVTRDATGGRQCMDLAREYILDCVSCLGGNPAVGLRPDTLLSEASQDSKK